MNYLYLAIALVIGVAIGIFIIGLFAGSCRSDLEMKIIEKDKRIKEQTNRIFELYNEMINYKGAAASEETRANLLAKANEDLQGALDESAERYYALFKRYESIFIKLDTLQAVEAKKFPAPEELLSISDNGNGNNKKLNIELDR